MKNNFCTFSENQIKTLTWWCENSPYKNNTALICDGAVRSGKTLCMSLSFMFWSMKNFNGQSFAICGKTITSLRRNVIVPLVATLEKLGIKTEEKVSKNYIDISFNNRTNRFYLFSGKDESSASLIQGITLGGVLFDEVALMPRSFVEQAIARCSVEGSKFFFNCNPENPYHWFYCEWIKKAKEKNVLYIHFTMKDNPSLSAEVRNRYEKLYSGKFYERFILGKWVANEGNIYTMFSKSENVVKEIPNCSSYYLSCDYGTVNPFSVGLWGVCGDTKYRIKEIYYNSKEKGEQKTDEEYYTMIKELCKGYKIEKIFVDPSAANFIECIKRHGEYRVIPANNDVVLGIRKVGELLKQRKLLFHESCENTFKEFALYCWETNTSKDIPKKENDHAMDDMRYFVMFCNDKKENSFFAFSSKRKF